MSMNEPLSKSQALMWIGIGIATCVTAAFAIMHWHSSQIHTASLTKSQFGIYLDAQREFRLTMRQDIQAIKITQDTTNSLIIDLIRTVSDGSK